MRLSLDVVVLLLLRWLLILRELLQVDAVLDLAQLSFGIQVVLDEQVLGVFLLSGKCIHWVLRWLQALGVF